MSNSRSKKMHFIRSNDMVLAGAFLGIVFWFLETAIHAYIFQSTHFLAELLPGTPNELWMRPLVVCLMILFGIFAQYMVNRRRRAEEALKNAIRELRILARQILNIQENERAEMSRELGNNISGYLCSIKYIIEESLNAGTLRLVDSNDISPDKIISMLQDAIQHTKTISMSLRPDTLDDLGIVATIQSFVDEFQELHPDICFMDKITVREEDVPHLLKLTIYRILQDTLKLLVLYSRADQVKVSLEKVGDCVKLDIRHNGMTFNWMDALENERSDRIDLAFIKERTELTDGVFSVESLEGWGTDLQASWTVCGGNSI